jgi:polar amino acid transport system substrate-binding protein
VKRPTFSTTWRAALGAGAMTVALALAGCGSSSSATSESPQPTTSETATGAALPDGADPAVVALLPASIKDKGELSVGMEAQYPPFEFYDADNKTIIGFDADIAAGLAKLMGLQLTLNDAAFDSIIPSLASGRYDLGISGFTVTAEREKQVDFVTYYYEGDGLMVKAGNPSNLTIGDSLCGVKIAVLKGSTQALNSVPELNKGCAAAGKADIDAPVVPGSNDLGLSLSSNRAEAVLTDGSNAAYTAKLSNGKFEVATGQPYNPAPFGIASPKGNGMDQAVQKAVEAMQADGSYLQALEKWGMQAGAIDTPKINEVSG